MPATPFIRSARADEAVPIPHQHHEGDPRGSGGGESPADAAGRAHSAHGGGSVQLAAARTAVAAEGGTHHPRGNEPCRGSGAGDAGGAAGGAVAGVGPLDRVWTGAAAHQGPGKSATSWPDLPTKR